jgi:hypothetical protein
VPVTSRQPPPSLALAMSPASTNSRSLAIVSQFLAQNPALDQLAGYQTSIYNPNPANFGKNVEMMLKVDGLKIATLASAPLHGFSMAAAYTCTNAHYII